MKPLHWSDLIAAVSVLVRTPPSRRSAAARSLIEDARRAEAYLDAHGQAHPFWGNGTLMGAALAQGGGAGPAVDDEQTLLALRDLAACLAQQRAVRSPQPIAQDTQRVAVKSSNSRPSGIGSSQSSHQP